MNAFKTIWYWILLIGLLAIIVGLIIAGCKAEWNGWSWGFVIGGIILVFLALILAFFSITSHCNHTHEHLSHLPVSPTYIAPSPVFVPSHVSTPTYVPSVPIVRETTTVRSLAPGEGPMSSVELPKIPPLPVSTRSSPLSSPTFTTTNVPQAQRGFVSSSLDLSSLAPL